MARSSDLGSFEQLVLLALLRLGREGYGMSVRAELVDRVGREVSLGAVYSTLERLENKGFVRSREEPGGSRRAGRARRFFDVTARGKKVLNETLRVLDDLRQATGQPELRPGFA